MVNLGRITMGQSGSYLQSEHGECWRPNRLPGGTRLISSQVDFFILSWAIHRLNGICLLLHPTNSVSEITSHMKAAKCDTIFTCQTLISTAIGAATQLSLPKSRIFTLPLPEDFLKNPGPIDTFTGLEELVARGSYLAPPEPLAWDKGQAKEQIAYLCATSGTSGKQVST